MGNKIIPVINLIDPVKTGSFSFFSTWLQSTSGGKFNKEDSALAQALNQAGFLT